MACTPGKTEGVPSMLSRRLLCTSGAFWLPDQFGVYTVSSWFFDREGVPAEVFMISSWSSLCFFGVGSDSLFSWPRVLLLRHIYIYTPSSLLVRDKRNNTEGELDHSEGREKKKKEWMGHWTSISLSSIIISLSIKSYVWCLIQSNFYFYWYYVSIWFRYECIYNLDSNGPHDSLLWWGFFMFLLLIQAMNIWFELYLISIWFNIHDLSFIWFWHDSIYMISSQIWHSIVYFCFESTYVQDYTFNWP